jgi:hypothetical protein
VTWRVRKRKVLKVLLGLQLGALLIGLTTLDWAFASVVVPLYLFSVAALMFATNKYSRDGDIEVIYTVFGANLRAIADLMARPDFASCYELTAEDCSRLAIMEARPGGIEFAQRLFADHRIRSDEPRAISRRIADVVLLLLGTLVGAAAQHRLAPPKGADAVIWHHNITAIIEYEPYTVTVLTTMIAFVLVASVIGSVRVRAVRENLIDHALRCPEWLIGVFLPGAPEVRKKIRDALRSASSLPAMNAQYIYSVEQITGVKIIGKTRRATALGEIQWMIFLFDMGIILGVVLPPMLGIG